MDFQTNIIDGSTIWFASELSFPINSNLFDPTWIHQNTDIQGTGLGRGQAIIFNYQTKTLVHRHYHRGGLFGRVVKDHYLGRVPTKSRAYNELVLLSSMRKLNLPVPQPIAARFEPHGITYKADILIEAISNSQTFLDALRHSEVTSSDCAQLGKVIAKFHVNGIDHTDLNIQNILIDKTINSGSLILINAVSVPKVTGLIPT